jgi:hypothetical protein
MPAIESDQARLNDQDEMASTLPPTTLYSLFDRMRERPVLWLGETSLTALWDFVNGYQFALSQHGIDEFLDPPFHEFHVFCAGYFQGASAAGWCRIILADNYGQEEQALRQFFSLFDQFRARVDVMRGRRIVIAFAHEIAFEQVAWRAGLPAFEQTLAACKQALCESYRARLAHEYDAVLRDLENISERDTGVRAILSEAVRIANLKKENT